MIKIYHAQILCLLTKIDHDHHINSEGNNNIAVFVHKIVGVNRDTKDMIQYVLQY